MDKEQWKNEVMDSLRNVRRAEPNPFLFTRIEAAIAKRIDAVTPRQWRIAIAFSVILILANGWVVLREKPSDRNSGSLFNNRYQIY